MKRISPRKFFVCFFVLQFLCFLFIPSYQSYVSTQAITPPYWPTADWLSSPPEYQGMSSQVLQGLTDHIQTHDLPLDSVLVVRHGYIVYENYPSGYGPENYHILYSVTKSFTSALVGIAVGQGYITSVDSTVVSIFSDRTIANRDARKEAMTVEDLLNMMAGLEWDEWSYPYSDPRNSVWQMISSGNEIQFMLDLPMVANPGAAWVYSTGVSHLLAGIINQTTGQLPLEFANDHLFGPLGITHILWTTDTQGINYGGHDLHLRPRDMAKFGFLYLQNGVWDGEQIIPSHWVQRSRQSVATPWGNTGYGYQWWKDQSLGTYEARGMYGQWIIINPEEDLVVVFTALDTEGEVNTLALVEDYVLAAITNQPPPSSTSPWFIGFLVGVAIIIPLALSGTFIYLRMKRAKS